MLKNDFFDQLSRSGRVKAQSHRPDAKAHHPGEQLKTVADTIE